MTGEKRRDALTGVETFIVGTRQARPNLAEGSRAEPGRQDCPFCPGGLEAPEHYSVRWFANRWPALGDDRCEVILYSPDHDASLATMHSDDIEELVTLWADRTSALGGRNDVAYVLVFENRGTQVGATIPHPHGQIYAFDSVPEAARRELDGTRCSLCTAPDDGLVVSRHGIWVAWVPEASSWPYELRFAPDTHVASLTDLSSSHRDLASLLGDCMGRLDRLFGEAMPYMLWIHQGPVDGRLWPLAHLHIHVAPVLRSAGVPRFVAAGELGSGVMFNPVDPTEAAAQLRDA